MLSVALHALERPSHAFRNFAVDAIEQEFAEAEDRIERRAQLMAHVRQELRLVPAGVLKAPVKLLQPLARRVDVLRERAKFVAVHHSDLLRKVTGCNTIEPLVDFLHRLDDRPGYGVAQAPASGRTRRARTRRHRRATFRMWLWLRDPVHHVRLGPVDELVRQASSRSASGASSVVWSCFASLVCPSRVSSSTRVAMAMKRDTPREGGQAAQPRPLRQTPRGRGHSRIG